VSDVVRAPRSEFDSSQNIFNSIQFNSFSKTTIHGARRADESEVTRAVARRPAFAPAEEIRASRRERAKRARTSEYTEDVRELNESEKSKKNTNRRESRNSLALFLLFYYDIAVGVAARAHWAPLKKVVRVVS